MQTYAYCDFYSCWSISRPTSVNHFTPNVILLTASLAWKCPCELNVCVTLFPRVYYLYLINPTNGRLKAPFLNFVKDISSNMPVSDRSSPPLFPITKRLTYLSTLYNYGGYMEVGHSSLTCQCFCILRIFWAYVSFYFLNIVVLLIFYQVGRKNHGPYFGLHEQKYKKFFS